MNTDLTIVVMTCDKYYDTWKPFISCFRKYFPDCQVPVVMSTENSKYAEKIGFDRVFYSDKEEWSGRLRDTLLNIKSEYIFLMLDDFWLNKKINKQLFFKDFNYAIENHVGTLYLNYEKWKFLEMTADGYYDWKHGYIYRANTRPAFWNVEYLISILDETENIWQFERKASKRGKGSEVLCCPEMYFKFDYAVTAGKFEHKAVQLAKREHIYLDLNYRKKRTFFEDILLKIRNTIFNICPEIITSIKEKKE